MGNEMLYLECCSGISGDMFVAVLLDLGADESVLSEALESLPLSGFQIEVKRVRKAGLDVCDFHVCLGAAYENHDHDIDYLYGTGNDVKAHIHAHEHHVHRTLQDVVEILDAAKLTARARDLAIRIFEILGEAEARIILILFIYKSFRL